MRGSYELYRLHCRCLWRHPTRQTLSSSSQDIVGKTDPLQGEGIFPVEKKKHSADEVCIRRHEKQASAAYVPGLSRQAIQALFIPCQEASNIYWGTQSGYEGTKEDGYSQEDFE